MALGIDTTTSAGDFLPIIKYDARAGRFSRIDRTPGDTGWENNQVDITTGFMAVFDLENIEIGWMNFNTGGAPDFRLAPLGKDAGTRPSEGHREGFRIMLKLSKEAGGDVREWCSVAKSTIGSLDALHDAYLKGVANNPGKLPIVSLESVQQIVTTGPNNKKSTNYAPVFKISKWVKRPDDMVFKPKTSAFLATNTSNGQATPPTTGSRLASPPAFGNADPPPWDEGESDFG